MLRAGVAAPNSMKNSIMPTSTWLPTLGLAWASAPAMDGARDSTVTGGLLLGQQGERLRGCGGEGGESGGIDEALSDARAGPRSSPPLGLR